MSSATSTKIEIFDSSENVSDALCQLVIRKANESIIQKDLFTIGLSGGSLTKMLSNGLVGQETDWTKWRVFFCDERCVPFDSEHCTYAVYKQDLFSQISLPEENVFPINPDLTVEECADDYLKKIRSIFPSEDIPRFDMLLLGMGPDGHTCSLFPDHQLLKETSRLVAPISDSPKPPPSRVTLTYPVINNCACAVFASCGASKAEVIQRVLEGNEANPLPAARVRPSNGEVVWFLDKSAAANLKNQKLVHAL